jgi:hypothetical protein
MPSGGHTDKFTFDILFPNSSTLQTGKKPDHCTKKLYSFEKLKKRTPGGGGEEKGRTERKKRTRSIRQDVRY